MPCNRHPITRRLRAWLCLSAAWLAAGTGGAGRTADAPAPPGLAFAAPPGWVRPHALPDRATWRPLPAADAPVAAGDTGAVVETLLDDQQVRFAGPVTTLYRARAVRILRPEVAAALSRAGLSWSPATDRVTVHALRLIRDGRTTDLLTDAPDGGFIVRPAAAGMATALRVVPGVRVGDIIAMAYSVDRRDPLLAGHHEVTLAADAADRVALAVQWSGGGTMAVRGEHLPARLVAGPGAVAITADGVTRWLGPAGAPERYARGRALALSDFADWAEVAAIVRPWFAAARSLPAASPLHREIARIAAARPDPAGRAGAALALVERAVAYRDHDGGAAALQPASADATWRAATGDCKGKVALLLALLDGLGIAASPALVSTAEGDGLEQRLPGLQVFDHVIVRAQVAGQTWWLDPTRVGDGAAAAPPVPPWHWALDVARGRLEPLIVPPATRPAAIVAFAFDARGGIGDPAGVQAEATLAGDAAQAFHAAIAPLPPARRAEALRGWWSRRHDGVAPFAVGERWDAAAGVEHLTMRGLARLAWAQEGGAAVWRPAAAQLPADPGPRRPGDADAPYAVAYPDFTEVRETIVLPDGGAGFRVAGEDVDAVIAGRAFWRQTLRSGDRVTTIARVRPLAPEVPGAEVRAAAPAIARLAASEVTIIAPGPAAGAPAQLAGGDWGPAAR